MLFTIPNFLRPMLLSLLVVCSAARVSAQHDRISIPRTNTTVGEIILTIEEETGVHVSYNKNLLDTSRTIALRSTALTLQEALDAIASATDTKCVVRGRLVAFVPSNDNSRPQVHGQPRPRTSDSYSANDPRLLSVTPVQRPAVATPEAAAAPVVAATEPAKPFRSDYSPVDIYANVQKALPRFALKVDLLYGLGTLTPNIAAEAALSPRSTVELSYGNNPWNYKARLPQNKKLLHGMVRAEYRLWLCERFSGHFLGAHALYTEYNVSGRNVPLLFDKKYRYQGNAWGGGISYGYDLPLGKRWNLEFVAGVGALRMKYDRYSCLTCAVDAEPATKTWLGPTNLGINLVFLIK